MMKMQCSELGQTGRQSSHSMSLRCSLSCSACNQSMVILFSFSLVFLSLSLVVGLRNKVCDVS